MRGQASAAGREGGQFLLQGAHDVEMDLVAGAAGVDDGPALRLLCYQLAIAVGYTLIEG